MTTVFLAIIIGGAFGFVLDRIGATDPNYVIGMLRLTKLHLLKTIFLATGLASVLMFSGLLLGIIDPSSLDVRTTYIGVFFGGILLGVGFAVSGYCPATGLAALASLRKDALFFVIGGIFGATAFMLSYERIAASGVLDILFGSPVTLGTIAGTDYPALFPGVSGEMIGIVVGIVLIVIAFVLPDRLSGSQHMVPPDEDPQKN